MKTPALYGTGETSVEVTSACGGVVALPTPVVWKVGWVSSKTVEAP